MSIIASCGHEVYSGNDLVPVEYDEEEAAATNTIRRGSIASKWPGRESRRSSIQGRPRRHMTDHSRDRRRAKCRDVIQTIKSKP